MTRMLRDHKSMDDLWEEVQRYLKYHHPSYSLYNEVVGCLECARLEHLRRGWSGVAVLGSIKERLYKETVAEYERGKISENGDIE